MVFGGEQIVLIPSSHKKLQNYHNELFNFTSLLRDKLIMSFCVNNFT